MERKYHLFWPLVLIATGVMWILIQTGRIPASNLWALAYVWPLLLIGAGLALILRPYWRYAGALMSVLAVGGLFLSVLFAPQMGWNRVPNPGLDGGWFLNGSTARGSGNVVTQNRAVSGFTTIHLNYPASVLIRQGSTESLTIEAEDNVAASIQTQVVNHDLEIDTQQNHRLFVVPTRPVRITITVKDLNELDFNSAGDVTVQGLKSDAFKALLDGAGSIKLENLQVGALDAQLSGAGSLEAAGAAESLTAQVDGLGSFEGASLKCKTANVTLNGLGSANIWADEKLTASINGMGSVSYSGNAQVTKSVNGLGTVNFTGNK